MKRRHASRAPLIATSLVLSLVVLVFVAPTARELAWRAVARRSISDERARKDLAGIVGGGDRLPRSMRTVEAQVDSGRDSTWWYKASLNPADVPVLKQHILAVMNRFPNDVNDADDFSGFTLGVRPPSWWKPQQLPDADVLRDKSCWCVFSRQTGTLYVVWMEF